MIIRVCKRDDPFARVPKDMLNDKRLSWRAKGILAYLLGKPNNWVVQREDVLAHGPERDEAVREAFKELRDCGYAVLKNTQSGREWHVSDSPHVAETAMCASGDSPMMGKSATTKNDKETKKECGRFKPPSLSDVVEHGKAIGVPASECAAFVDHHEARGWWLAKGVKMVDWKRALSTWKRNIKAFAPRTRQPYRNGPEETPAKRVERQQRASQQQSEANDAERERTNEIQRQKVRLLSQELLKQMKSPQSS